MRRFLASILLLAAAAGAPALLAQTGNIDPARKYAWLENGGWLDFRPSFGGVTVRPTYLTGYAWSENAGWIKLGVDAGGPYANTTGLNYGINNSSGTLSGYAWSENGGWIRFDPQYGGVTIDGTGLLVGYAWSENLGWIHLSNASPAYGVATACPLQTWYRDADGDGHGNPLVTVLDYCQPVGYVAIGDDCDDTRATVYPGAPELCDGLDNNCDGVIDNPGFAGASSVTALPAPSCGYRVTWSAAIPTCDKGVTYNVYRSTSSSFLPGGANRIATCVSGTSYDDSTGLASGTTYYYLVRAEAGSGGGGACGGIQDGNLVRMSSAQLSCGAAPDPLQIFALTAKDQTVALQWIGPASGPAQPYSILFRSRIDTIFPTGPSDGILQWSASGQSFGASGSHTLLGMTNDTTYRFGAFADNGAATSYSGGKYALIRPFATTGKVKWVYTTGASATTPPGLKVGVSLFDVSNDRILHGMGVGPTGGEWPAGWKPMVMNAPSQARPIPIQLTGFTIGGASLVVFLGSQDGRVYAANGATGSPLWASSILGDAIQPSPSACLVQFGCTTDLVFAPTRNGASDNKVYALDPLTGSYTGGKGWTFDNGGGASGIGIISGQIAVQYGFPPRLYFASRQKAGGTTDTVFCLEFDNTSATKKWSRTIGDVDGSVVLVGTTLYVGTNTGQVYALNTVDGTDKWPAPYTVVADGAVNGMIWPDGAGKLYFATGSKVHSITDNGQGVAPTTWWTTPVSLLAPSNPFVINGKAYVGAGDGKLYEIDATTQTPAPATGILLGDPATPGAVGRPTYDNGNHLLYVGTEAGMIYAVSVPF